MAEGVGDCDGAAHAVAEEMENKPRMARAGEAYEGVDVGDGVVHAVDEASLPRGPAVAAVVQGIRGEAGRIEAGSDVAVAARVLADAVRDDDPARGPSGGSHACQ